MRLRTSWEERRRLTAAAMRRLLGRPESRGVEAGERERGAGLPQPSEEFRARCMPLSREARSARRGEERRGVASVEEGWRENAAVLRSRRRTPTSLSQQKDGGVPLLERH